jgi:hypothetical protein
MNHRSTRLMSLAGALAIVAGTLMVTPAMASCIALDERLPDPATPGAVVVLATVAGVEGITTQLQVDEWYLGAKPADVVVVAGGRDPALITSADWVPTPGERYVVVATEAADGSLSTAVCEQQWPTPELLAALMARYGEPILPPFPASPGSPSPGAAGSPAASPDVPSETSPLP